MVTKCNFYGGVSISIKVLNAIKKLINNMKFNVRTRKLAISFASFAVIFTVMVTVLGVSNFTYAMSVSVNGASYGYVSSEQDASDAIVNLLDRYVVADGDTATEPNVNCTPAVVPANSLMSSGELADKIVEHSSEYITATTVFVNGNLFARADSKEAAEAFIVSEIGDGKLYNDIEFRDSVMSPQSFNMLPDFSEVCYAEVDATVNFSVTDSTTLEEVKSAYKSLSATNAPNSIISGTVLSINTTLPALAVSDIVDTVLEHKVTAYESGSKAGTVTTTVRTYEIYGVPYKSEVLSEEFTEKYADKPIATEIVDAGEKGFCWPVDTGYTQYTSSYWGDGRGHKGYDIACKTGTPILAANEGYVESVNSSGSGYGLHFIIKHPNGLRTLYSHCSKLYVSEGDTVSRGEVVALVGTSGNVTGSHLHFEVRNGNNAILNPKNYIGKR